MADLPETFSPLDKLGISPTHHEDAGVSLAERKFIGKLNLRGKGDDPAFQIAVKKGLGIDLPLTPNRVAQHGSVTILWLAPDEWLIMTEPGQEHNLHTKLAKALAGHPHAVVNVSDNSTILRLSGRDARRLLMKGCSLDLHPREFEPGHCAQTILGRANITISQLDNTPSYDILVRNSFAEYMWTWLMDAGLEYSIEVISEN